MSFYSVDDLMKWCKECGQKQFMTPSGITCENGHGGCDSLEDPQKDEIALLAFQYVLRNRKCGTDTKSNEEIPRTAGVIIAARTRIGTKIERGISKEDPSKSISVPQNVIWVIYERPNAKEGRQFLFKLLEGGITGYESFYIDSYVYEDILRATRAKEEDYWVACAGTAGSWDRLVVPGVRKLIMDFLVKHDLDAEIHAGLR